MKISIISSALAILLIIGTGCKKTDNLQSKKDELTALMKERQAINKRIHELENEISKLDSTASNADPRIPVMLMEIRELPFEHQIKVQGQIESDNNIMVSPQMPGVITQIFVEEGQNVGQGQILAQLDDDVLNKSMEELNTQYALAKELFEKQERLWKQQIGSEVQYLQAKTQKEALEKRIQTTKEQQSQLKVVSPINGVVDEIFSKRGEGVAPGFPAFRIVNLSDLSFTADVSEAYIPMIKKGDKVNISFPAVSYDVEASITSVGQTINPANRTIQVKIDLPGKHELLKTNMVGELSIRDYVREKAISIPMDHLMKDASGSYVFVAEESDTTGLTVKKTYVTTGTRSGDKIEITEGLKAGQRLVTEGGDGLREGDKVRLSPM